MTTKTRWLDYDYEDSSSDDDQPVKQPTPVKAVVPPASTNQAANSTPSKLESRNIPAVSSSVPASVATSSQQQSQSNTNVNTSASKEIKKPEQVNNIDASFINEKRLQNFNDENKTNSNQPREHYSNQNQDSHSYNHQRQSNNYHSSHNNNDNRRNNNNNNNHNHNNHRDNADRKAAKHEKFLKSYLESCQELQDYVEENNQIRIWVNCYKMGCYTELEEAAVREAFKGIYILNIDMFKDKAGECFVNVLLRKEDVYLLPKDSPPAYNGYFFKIRPSQRNEREYNDLIAVTRNNTHNHKQDSKPSRSYEKQSNSNSNTSSSMTMTQKKEPVPHFVEKDMNKSNQTDHSEQTKSHQETHHKGTGSSHFNQANSLESDKISKEATTEKPSQSQQGHSEEQQHNYIQKPEKQVEVTKPAPEVTKPVPKRGYNTKVVAPQQKWIEKPANSEKEEGQQQSSTNEKPAQTNQGSSQSGQ